MLAEQGAGGKEQDYTSLHFLVSAHAVSYAYSATLLQQQQSRKQRETKRDYLAFAPVFANGLPAGTRSGDFLAENLSRDSVITAMRVRAYLPMTKKEVTGI
ncbi:hypothetical protein HUU05_19060 [candidate division KSB1 bacterium]|nr:hypothetical protein [candidate division KSB1 bacterium]